MSPETASSVFPDRLIHPLPKRRLRERLSPNVAESIQYPPSHVTGTPLFYYPYNLKDDVPTAISERASIFGGSAKTTPAPPPARPPRQESPALPHFGAHRSSVVERESALKGPFARHSTRPVRRLSTTHMPPHPESQPAAPSAASSVDGYDSFENTNNKKKRKIPTASDASHAGSYTSTEVHSTISGASTATSNDESSIGSASSHVYSSPASFIAPSPGISGPGRGRYGRNRNGRTPLRPLSDAGSNWAGRNGKLSPTWPAPLESDQGPASSGNSGIISNAIANAEKASREQENADRGKPQSSVMSTPASAQFTFTCSSQVPGNLTWPGSDPRIPTGSSAWQQGRLRGGFGHGGGASGHDKSREGTDETDGTNGSPRGSEGGDAKQADKAAARKLNRELQKQARERKRSQQRQNVTNPTADEGYMCPFCEYETIFHRKPRSLIRSFELRERKKREQAEERQRLLDKAKARGRKGKKASRAAAAATAPGPTTSASASASASASTASSTSATSATSATSGNSGNSATSASSAAPAASALAKGGGHVGDDQPPGGRADGERPDDVQTGDGYYEADDDGGGVEENIYSGPGVETSMRGPSHADNLTAHPTGNYHIPVVS